MIKLAALFLIISAQSSVASGPEDSAIERNSSLSEFEIFGMNSKNSYSGKFKINGQNCNIRGRGIEYCYKMYGTVIGLTNVERLIFMFNDGKMAAVSGVTPSSKFSEISSAFEAKYGKPNKVEEGVWQNRLGAKFDNITKIWVFSDGFLELVARGDKVDEAKFRFYAIENAPKAEKPTVNF